MRPRPAHAVVGGWAAANLGLALGLLAFRPGTLELMIHIAATAAVAGFGLAVLVALRTGREGPQVRQPRRATAGVLVALGLAVGLSGFAYGWWLALLGIYPLLLGALLGLARRERLPLGAQPWPVALDGAEPAGHPSLAHDGSSLGAAVALPADHPGHGPPTPAPSSEPSKVVHGAVTLATAVGAVRTLLRRRKK